MLKLFEWFESDPALNTIAELTVGLLHLLQSRIEVLVIFCDGGSSYLRAV